MSSNSVSGAPYRYWDEIDTQLRRAALDKRMKVRLLISDWAHSQPFMLPFLKSLASIHEPKLHLDIQVVSGCDHCMSAVRMNPESNLISSYLQFRRQTCTVRLLGNNEP